MVFTNRQRVVKANCSSFSSSEIQSGKLQNDLKNLAELSCSPNVYAELWAVRPGNFGSHASGLREKLEGRSVCQVRGKQRNLLIDYDIGEIVIAAGSRVWKSRQVCYTMGNNPRNPVATNIIKPGSAS